MCGQMCGCISKTVSYRKLMLDEDINCGCRYAMPLCDLYFTFGFVIVTHPFILGKDIRWDFGCVLNLTLTLTK